jgi:hypothetical protein
MKTLCFLILAIALSSCAHKETTSADAKKALVGRYEERIGKATKEDLIEDFGNPEWCRPQEETGNETCRFYRKKDTKWMGGKKDRVHYEAYDQIFADFDSSGVLKTFKASAQR